MGRSTLTSTESLGSSPVSAFFLGGVGGGAALGGDGDDGGDDDGVSTISGVMARRFEGGGVAGRRFQTFAERFHLMGDGVRTRAFF